MEKSTIQITKLKASEGMTLTNGESFAKEIYLGCNDSSDNWWEIPDAEAAVLQAEYKAKLEREAASYV